MFGSGGVFHFDYDKLLSGNAVENSGIGGFLSHGRDLGGNLYGRLLIELVCKIVHFEVEIMQKRRIVHRNHQISMSLPVFVLIEESRQLLRL